MQAKFIAPESPQWTEVLHQGKHDFYHLPQYVVFSQRYDGGHATAFLAEEGEHRLFIPLIVRPVPDLSENTGREIFDATSPYGYPGPLVFGPETGGLQFMEKAMRLFIESLRERNIVTAFVRLHPLLPVPLEPLARFGYLVQHGETVSINLTLPYEELWRQTRQNHRRDINKAAREGFTVSIDTDWNKLDSFIEIYLETMHRVQANPYYHFGADYFTGLLEALGSRLHLSTVQVSGEVVAAGLFTECNGIVQYHLGGTRDAYLKYAPAKIMFHFVRVWAKERGNYVFHLGGGVGGRKDSLFNFKAGFSNSRHPFYTWRVVADAATYRELNRIWESRSGTAADGPGGFFPAYRKPLPGCQAC